MMANNSFEADGYAVRSTPALIRSNAFCKPIDNSIERHGVRRFRSRAAAASECAPRVRCSARGRYGAAGGRVEESPQDGRQEAGQFFAGT